MSTSVKHCNVCGNDAVHFDSVCGACHPELPEDKPLPHDHVPVHFHEDLEQPGVFHRCYHVCRHWMKPSFWAGWIVASTITFPMEHVLWIKIRPFSYVGAWVGETQPQFPLIASILAVIFYTVLIIAGVYYATKKYATAT